MNSCLLFCKVSHPIAQFCGGEQINISSVSASVYYRVILLWFKRLFIKSFNFGRKYEGPHATEDLALQENNLFVFTYIYTSKKRFMHRKIKHMEKHFNFSTEVFGSHRCFITFMAYS